MPKKSKLIEKTFQFNCLTCRKIYQLIETHYLRNYLRNGECSDNCQTKWQSILHEYHQEKVLAYLAQKEQLGWEYILNIVYGVNYLLLERVFSL